MIYIKTLYKKFGEIKKFFHSAYCFEIHQCYWMYYYFFPFLIEQYSIIEYAKVFKSIFLLIDNWKVSSFLGIKNQLLTSSVWFGMHGASVQFSSVAQSCLTLCSPMNHSTPGLPVHHQLPQFTQTHAHRVSDAIQPSHPLSFPFPPAPNPSQHQSLFQWVNSSHEVAKVLEFQL